MTVSMVKKSQATILWVPKTRQGMLSRCFARRDHGEPDEVAVHPQAYDHASLPTHDRRPHQARHSGVTVTEPRDSFHGFVVRASAQLRDG
jgi:hypothetical protein